VSVFTPHVVPAAVSATVSVSQTTQAQACRLHCIGLSCLGTCVAASQTNLSANAFEASDLRGCDSDAD
jgi:hypothetical protein